MPESHSPLAGIIDIEPPPAPPAGGGDELLLAGVALLLIIAAGYLLWRRHAGKRGQSRRRLARLRRRYLAGQIDSRKAAFELATILRQRLAASHLTPTLPAHLQSQQPRWQTFLDGLSSARYAPATANHETMLMLFEDAHYWVSSVKSRP